MASPEGIRVSVGETKYIGDAKVTVSRVKPRDVRRKPNDTCYHEAAHAVVGKADGLRVRRVSVKPGPGYAGITELSGFSAAAAMAAKANGHRHTGWDEFITERQGHNLRKEEGKAKAILDANREAVEEVAYELAEKQTLDDAQVENAIQRSGEVIFDIERHGVKLRTRARVGKREPIVIVKNEWVDLLNKPVADQISTERKRRKIHAPENKVAPILFPGSDKRRVMRNAA